MPWRLEYAKTARGGCSMAECKHREAKIAKDDMKLGYWVDPPNSDPFWSFRHWGCATKKVLEQIKQEIDGDPDALDGFDELIEKDQERVAQALQNGEIPEEDKTVYSAEEEAHYQQHLDDEELLKEMRREAKANDQTFDIKVERKRLQDQRDADRKMERDAIKANEKAAKQAEKEAKKAEKEAEKEAKRAAKEAAKAAKANGSKKRKAVKDEDEDEAPVVKKARGKNAVKDEDDSDDAEAPPIRRSGRAKKASVVKNEEESEEEIKPKTKSARGKKVKKEDVSDAEMDGSIEDASEEEEEVKPKAKAKGTRASKRTRS